MRIVRAESLKSRDVQWQAQLDMDADLMASAAEEMKVPTEYVLMQSRTARKRMRTRTPLTPHPKRPAAVLRQVVNASWTGARGQYASARRACHSGAGLGRDANAGSWRLCPEFHAYRFPLDPLIFLNQDLLNALAAGTCWAAADAVGVAFGFGRPLARAWQSCLCVFLGLGTVGHP